MKRVFLISFSLMSFSVLAERPIRGTYEVPVSDELRAYASYPVHYKADSYEEDNRELSFPLPAALIGAEKSISMSKVSESEWVGPNANGSCKIEDRYFKCTVKFNDLNIDEEKVEQAVSAQYSVPEEKFARLKVASKFSGEPIGIISYKLRGRDRSR